MGVIIAINAWNRVAISHGAAARGPGMSSDDRSWHTPSHPELRDGPPWVMEEMIKAQPGLAAPIAAAAGAEAIAAADHAGGEAGDPIVVVGCGTSEHGALAVAALLDEALRAAGSGARRVPPGARRRTRPARGRRLHRHLARRHDARDDPRARRGARDRGGHGDDRRARRLAASRSAPITSLITPLRDRSWCHTVAYSSTILAGAAIAREIAGGDELDGARSSRRARAAAADRAARGAHPRRGADPRVGLGADLDHGARARAEDRGGRADPGDGTATRVAPARPPGRLRRRDDGARAVRRAIRDRRAGVDRLQSAAAAAAAIGIPTVAIGAEAALARLPGERRAPRRAARRRRAERAARGRGRAPAPDARARPPGRQQPRPHPPRAARLPRGGEAWPRRAPTGSPHAMPSGRRAGRGEDMGCGRMPLSADATCMGQPDGSPPTAAEDGGTQISSDPGMGDFRALIERLPLMAYVDGADPSSPNLWVSRQSTQMFGYAPEEWSSRPRLLPHDPAPGRSRARPRRDGAHDRHRRAARAGVPDRAQDGSRRLGA